MPMAVRISLSLWWLAIGMALVELAAPALGTGNLSGTLNGRGVELAVRGTAFGFLVALSLQMARGRNWARLMLALIFGLVGTLSLVMEPIGWIAAGGRPLDYLARADVVDRIIVISRTAHLLCVLAATALMFTPDSRRFFGASAIFTHH
jgi:hypothetical protein